MFGTVAFVRRRSERMLYRLYKGSRVCDFFLFFFFSVVVVVLFLCFVSFEGIFCKMELFSLGLCAGVGAGAQQLLEEVRGGMEDGRSRPPSACRGAEG